MATISTTPPNDWVQNSYGLAPKGYTVSSKLSNSEQKAVTTMNDLATQSGAQKLPMNEHTLFYRTVSLALSQATKSKDSATFYLAADTAFNSSPIFPWQSSNVNKQRVALAIAQCIHVATLGLKNEDYRDTLCDFNRDLKDRDFESALEDYIELCSDFEEICAIKRNNDGLVDFEGSFSPFVGYPPYMVYFPTREEIIDRLRYVAESMDREGRRLEEIGSWAEKLRHETEDKNNGKRLTDIELILWLLKSKNRIQNHRVKLGINGHGVARTQLTKPPSDKNKGYKSLLFD